VPPSRSVGGWRSPFTARRPVIDPNADLHRVFLPTSADLPAEMALRFEKAFGVNMDTSMQMQNSYDVAQTRSPAFRRSQAGRAGGK